jgi:hypothetical protein
MSERYSLVTRVGTGTARAHLLRARLHRNHANELDCY